MLTLVRQRALESYVLYCLYIVAVLVIFYS